MKRRTAANIRLKEILKRRAFSPWLVSSLTINFISSIFLNVL
jgi:hypothetical protein